MNAKRHHYLTYLREKKNELTDFVRDLEMERAHQRRQEAQDGWYKAFLNRYCGHSYWSKEDEKLLENTRIELRKTAQELAVLSYNNSTDFVDVMHSSGFWEWAEDRGINGSTGLIARTTLRDGQ